MKKHFNKAIELYRYLLTVLAFNVPVIYIILIFNTRNVDFSFITWLYFSLVVIGYYVFPLWILMTFTSILFFSIKQPGKILTGIVISVFVYYLLIDSIVFNITRIHIDPFWLEWVINDFKAFGLPSSTLRAAFLFFLLILCLEAVFFILAKKIRPPKRIILRFALITILSFSVSQAAHAVAYQRNDVRITSLTPNLPAYVPVTSHKNASRYGSFLPIGEDGPGDYDGGRNSPLIYPRNEMIYNMPEYIRLPNIVVIFLESWRFDMMNEKVTPNIYALSEKSSVFLNHIASGNSTVAGVFGFFYGLEATYWTSVKANNALIDNPVLIDVLGDNHYAFGIYAKSNFERHKIKDAIFRGIDVHETFTGETKIEQDKDMTRQVNEFIREQHESGNPYFAFAFYKSNHFPYRYPPEDSVFLPAEDLNLVFADGDTDPAFYRNDYMNSTHYVDRLVGRIIDRIDSLGDMSNTAIIITTDHSDELNDNRANYWGHGSNFTKYQTMVPLVFYLPGWNPRKVEYTTSHIDIVPTILQEYFGCANDIRDYSNGRNLFDKPDGARPIVVGNYVNHAFIIGDDVFEIYPMYTRKYKLYDIKTEASSPSPEAMQTIKDEITCFYRKRVPDTIRAK